MSNLFDFYKAQKFTALRLQNLGQNLIQTLRRLNRLNSETPYKSPAPLHQFQFKLSLHEYS